jgi:hypothetical protein
MRFLVLFLMLLASTASAETTIVVARRPVIVTAQDHALVLARRGTLVHSSCGQTEGIGCGATAQSARENCCFYRDALAGRRVIVEEGVAYSPVTRRWFAVIRYR